jgi:glyoxylase-like metal-dependent hydrolase (beta-lactamase superfamily II)
MSIATHNDLQIPGLEALGAQPLPFAPSLEIRAFVLERERGNVLVYSTAALGDPGDISRWYLNHGHEAMFVSDSVTAPLFVHERDRRSVEPRAHVRATFSRRHTLDDDFEAIPTPGHTPGATAYLWDNGEHRFLFTGDTVYLHDGEWVAAVLDSSDRAAYLDSLELIRELDFDVLVPWAASAGEPYHAVTSRADARRRIDAIAKRVREGAQA